LEVTAAPTKPKARVLLLKQVALEALQDALRRRPARSIAGQMIILQHDSPVQTRHSAPLPVALWLSLLVLACWFACLCGCALFFPVVCTVNKMLLLAQSEDDFTPDEAPGTDTSSSGSPSRVTAARKVQARTGSQASMCSRLCFQVPCWNAAACGNYSTWTGAAFLSTGVEDGAIVAMTPLHPRTGHARQRCCARAGSQAACRPPFARC